MIYLSLLITFFKIGLFSFGGGYAMIPMIEREIESHGWLSPAEFIDIIAIAEMTPGPIAVNSATFVGFKTAGILGGLFATLGVALPSLLLILLISQFFFKYSNHPIKDSIFYGVRPVIAGLIFSASIFVARTALLKQSTIDNFFRELMSNPLKIINLGGILILAISLFVLIKLKLHPIVTIVISGVLGILFYYVLPTLGFAGL
ncbi:MAG TPA: chromate transporter [Clostridiaceae bacterium]|jgi:chromate transporter|nr:chromate transporter [Clostridiaceae bacterium]